MILTFDYVELSGLIAEAARSALDEWDIDKTIKEVKKSPEIITLQNEIETLKAINQIFNK